MSTRLVFFTVATIASSSIGNKVRLSRLLRGKRPSPNRPATGTAHHHRTRQHRSIPGSRYIIGEHVVSGRDEVNELHLAHWPHSHVCSASRRANDCRLRNGRIDHPLLAVLRHQSFGDLERTAVGANVLAKAEYVLVALHLLEERFANRLEIGGLRHRASPSSPDARALQLPI